MFGKILSRTRDVFHNYKKLWSLTDHGILKIHGIWRDRRGVTAVVLGVAAAGVFGMAALATEGGAWYYQRRNAQNAADAAAYAGATRLLLASAGVPAQTLGSAQAFARAAVTDATTRNGFVNGTSQTTITINTPPSIAAAPLRGDPTAVEVRIRRTVTRSLSSLFVGGTQAVEGFAVAKVQSNGNVCLLALGVSGEANAISGTGSARINAPGCTVASNATGAASIRWTGGAGATAAALITSGGCSGCDSTVKTYQPPSSNPFAYLDQTSFVQGSCAAPPQVSKGGTITVPASGSITFCSDLKVTGNGALVLTPGTYIFWNASFQMTGNTSATCPTCTGGQGITMIFTGTGSSIGGISLSGGASLTLTAPSSGPYRGVLMYRDVRAPAGNCNNPPIQLTGGSALRLTGALYFPSSCVKYTGNSGSASTSCLVLVTGAISLTGTADLATTGCAAAGVPVPVAQIVRVVM